MISKSTCNVSGKWVKSSELKPALEICFKLWLIRHTDKHFKEGEIKGRQEADSMSWIPLINGRA